jgi:hypothetical protein
LAGDVGMEEFNGVAVKRRLCVCYSAAIFGVCSYSETVIVPVLKILYQETTGGECNRLRRVVCV